MKKKNKHLIIIIIFGLIWGGSQSIIFPPEIFGITWLFSCIIGGGLIGYFVPKLIK